MFKTSISMSESPILSISTRCELYNACFDSLQVSVRAEVDSCHRIRSIARNVGINLEILWSGGGEFTWISKNVTQIEAFFNQLLLNNLIDGNDRYHLREHVLAIEKIFLYRKKITQTPPSVAQRDIIVEIARPYIEALLDKTQNYKDIVPVIYHTDSKFCEYRNPFDLWRKWLENRNQREINESVDCMKHLSTMMNGTMDLYSTFVQTGVGIPPLQQQREILFNAITDAFNVRYGTTRKNKFEAFYVDRALQKMLHGRSLYKTISCLYNIQPDSGFPQLATTKRYSYTEHSLIMTSFDCVPDLLEENLLRKYGLKRFPTSVEDLPAASAIDQDEVVKDPVTLQKLIDGELYPHMSPEEQLRCAVDDNACEEVIRIISTFEPSQSQLQKNIALLLAIQKKNVPLIGALITLGADVNFQPARSSRSTPLHEAALTNDLRVLRLLIEAGALLTSTDIFGRIPLHQLFCYRSSTTQEEMEEMIKLLMPTKSLVDLAIVDRRGETCFQIARELHHDIGLVALQNISKSPQLR